ncbi:MAG: nicotine adenine dinucleotide glycohydrolase [Spirochaetales bacterium]|nr:nicotine adenine dinucleotide glycohydrolase [Spirochaetales bacterium]
MKKSLICLASFVFTIYTLTAQSAWFEAQKDEAVIKSVTATSELIEGQYDGKYLYPPINILDGSFDTTWCEADQNGPGIGESITIEFEHAVSFDEIQIVNGFVSGNDYYGKNNRVKGLRITQVAGKHFQQKDYTLSDKKPNWQSIQFELLQTAQILTLKITDVYKGSKYDDTCLCDIRLMYKGKPIPFKNVAQIKKVQEENSRYALNNSTTNFEQQFFSLFRKSNSDTLFLMGNNPKESMLIKIDNTNAKTIRIVHIDEIAILPTTDTTTLRNNINAYTTKEFGTNFNALLGWLDEFEPSQADWISLEVPSGYEWGKRIFYEIGNSRILVKENIDYIDVTTILLVKIDGDRIFLNGVPYTILDSSRVRHQVLSEL